MQEIAADTGLSLTQVRAVNKIKNKAVYEAFLEERMDDAGRSLARGHYMKKHNWREESDIE